MSKLNFSKGKFSRFMSSKGFYLALVVCLVGASVATWLAVDRTITGIERGNTDLLQQQEAQQPAPPFTEEVEQKQPNVPQQTAPRAQSSAPSVSQPSSSTSSSSAEEPAQPTVASAPSTPQATSPTLTYVLPIRGDVIQQFSDGELVKNPTLSDWRTHDGMDIYAEKGADICAAADGTVAEVRNDPLWGTVVVIDHADGMQTQYCGLHQNVAVTPGDAVSAKR